MEFWENLKNNLNSYSEKRKVRSLIRRAGAVLERSKKFDKFSKDDFRKKTEELKEWVRKGASLEDALIDSFALACAAICQVLGYRPFPVQIAGGMSLHQGKVVEMKTGEGKTIVGVLPAFLNSLSGHGVHIITTNDYLAKRDSHWMGSVFDLLGVSVGIVTQEMESGERRENYNRDITYVSNQEVGFDYLKDNVVHNFSDQILKSLNFAIIDEIDSILIDEVRTPLVISQPTGQSAENFRRFAELVENLEENRDYEVDRKLRVATMTSEGLVRANSLYGKDIFTPDGVELAFHLHKALQAKAVFQRDEDYIIFNDEVILVDEFTGRQMPGRRFMEGLHEAIEAKERVKIQKKDKVIASITFQNFFKLYKKISGMTGTIGRAKKEFLLTYGMESAVIPTNIPVKRIDAPDRYFDSEEEKLKILIKDVVSYREVGNPILIGTRSTEKSEMISRLLKKIDIPHHVLNAKYHELEAELVARAGAKYSVLVATNMAGRGTDIAVNDEVRQLGGLIVLGSERNLAKRIDDQLRGRSGRQGDPGFSQFYVSLEDELIQNFTHDDFWDHLESANDRGQLPKYEFLASNTEHAQEISESLAFDSRFHLKQFDELINKQRLSIYALRNTIIGDDDLFPEIKSLIGMAVGSLAESVNNRTVSSGEQAKRLTDLVRKQFRFGFKIADNASRENIVAALSDQLEKLALGIAPQFRQSIMKKTTLKIIDIFWSSYLDSISLLSKEINLVSVSEHDPIVEFIKEADLMFKKMLNAMRIEILKIIFVTFYKISDQK